MSCEFEHELMDLKDDADAKQGKSIQGKISFYVLHIGFYYRGRHCNLRI